MSAFDGIKGSHNDDNEAVETTLDAKEAGGSSTNIITSIQASKIIEYSTGSISHLILSLTNKATRGALQWGATRGQTTTRHARTTF